MERSYRDLLRHSGVYGLGHILARLASVLLLPVYTRFLTREDYGILAILDLTVALLAIVLASGTVRAVARYHFETESERERDALWWTGLALLVVTGVVLLAPAVVFRERLGAWTLGADEVRGGFLYLLALGTLALTTVEQLFQSHLRVYRQSSLFVALSLGRLALNIAANLWLLIVRDLGVAAILWGNLITAAVSVAALFAVFARRRGAPRLRGGRVGQLFSYGTPLIVASLLAAAMHQLDRYLLRLLLDLGEVGIYQVAYMLGQGINTLFLQPFSQIWYVVMYEIGDRPTARRVAVRVFRHFFALLAVTMLGVSLAAEPLLGLLVAPEFRAAAGVVPVVCLAYVFFSLNSHFNVPVLVAKRTSLMIPPHAIGVAVNLAANLLLIPRLGIYGAAWASVITFGAFSLSGLAIYRRVERVDYPLTSSAAALVGMTLSFLAWQRIASWPERPLLTALVAAAIWSAWAALLLWPLWRGLRNGSLLAELRPRPGR